MTQDVADLMLARLRDWDVRTVFGYAGDGINGLPAAWGRAGNEPEFVQARHEELAAFEAVGYDKFSGSTTAISTRSPESCVRWTALRSSSPPSGSLTFPTPATPPIPPHATRDQMQKTARALLHDTEAWNVVKEGVQSKAQEFLPGSRDSQ